MRVLLFVPVYPLLLALAIPFQLFSKNLAVFVFEDVARSIVLFLLGTLIVMAILFVATRRLHVACFVTGFVLVLLWAPALENFGGLLMVILPFLVGGIICLRAQPRTATAIINAYMVAFLAFPTYAFVSELLWERQNRTGKIEYSVFNELAVPDNEPRGELPSIYHILLDGYSNNRILSEVYGFSNKPFTIELKALGFAVSEDTRSPYNQTSLTMASIFSGEYLDKKEYPMTIPDESWLRIALGYIVTNGPIRRYLDRLGYRSAFTRADLRFYRYRDDDIVISPEIDKFSPNEFERFLISHTSFKYFESEFYDAIGASPTGINQHIALVKNAVESDAMVDRDGPLFLYQHILGPHPPFVIDREGNPTRKWYDDYFSIIDGDRVTRGEPELQKLYQEGYLEKLRYLNTAILRQVRRIIDGAERPTVIIIHGDHGGGTYYYNFDKERTCLNERYSPFLAIYTSERDLQSDVSRALEKRINLANLYRIVFNTFFSENFDLLPDRSHFAADTNPQNPDALSAEKINRKCQLLP